MDSSKLPIVISAVALIVSLFALWVNALRPFRLKVSHDTPRFRLYRITPEISGSEDGSSWWIPSFDLGLSFYNVGKRSGEVSDVRIVGHLDGHRSRQQFVFYPKWVVDYATFQRAGSERFKWINSAVLRDWYPFTLGGESEKDLHLVLEPGRWDHKQIGELSLELEVFSSGSGKWTRKASYKLSVTDSMFDSKSSYAPYDEKMESRRNVEA
ncbi:hypothetical protein [Xanthomonas dyei]|uniref:hypothetical protein n=1 Tax=Xanthomonas dyei TaxID=743699 RepID=UPI001E48BF47|nr:hypothetical protein [Xanthomonas dyei]MCC4632019.1 hypothetical protein [Xanthomonas dyei pv. eucalypti]